MSESPKLDELAKRIVNSRSEIARLERQIIDDREAINAEVENLFPNKGRPLTPRQRDVLELVKKGMANKNIADVLHISERTVKFHVTCLLEKFRTQNRWELADLSERVTGEGK